MHAIVRARVESRASRSARAITFANGERQVVNLDKMIGARMGATMIDLQGRSRQISKIVVSGKGGFRSGYSLAAA